MTENPFNPENAPQLDVGMPPGHPPAALCVHYNGALCNERCRAGVRYRDVAPPDPPKPGKAEDLSGFLIRLPCQRDWEASLQFMSRKQKIRLQRRGNCALYEPSGTPEVLARPE
jgi:hypothetical protein